MNELVKVENGNLILDEQYAEDYKELLRLQKKLELGTKEVNQRVKDLMEELGKTNLESHGIVFTYKKGTSRTSVDAKRLKEECPDIYEEYSKTSPVASSVTVTILD